MSQKNVRMFAAVLVFLCLILGGYVYTRFIEPVEVAPQEVNGTNIKTILGNLQRYPAGCYFFNVLEVNETKTFYNATFIDCVVTLTENANGTRFEHCALFRSTINLSGANGIYINDIVATWKEYSPELAKELWKIKEEKENE